MTADPPPDPRCGSETGYMQHVRAETPKCTPCKRAHADRRADYRRRRYLNHAPLSVDAAGTRRRIQALAAIGWSLAEQSRRLGWNASVTHKLTGRSWVWVETAEKVRGLFDELSMVPGPNQRARNEAAKRGWLPPLAYDDDQIDNPAHIPQGMAAVDWETPPDEVAIHRAMRGDPPERLTRTERLETVRRLTDQQFPSSEIADRLGVSQRQVDRDRADLARSANGARRSA